MELVGNPDFHIVHRFVRSLVRSGVRHVCISPGSRSTPLTMAFASLDQRTDAPKLWTMLDERSAAYFALGLARSTGTPVVLVCTSGTAVANYLPAVVEAHQARLPLILLTADRPQELREIGSNQTIHQVGLFGSHVKWVIEMPVPDARAADLDAHAESTAWRVVGTAMAVPQGPVHVNYPFREPLVPGPFEDSLWTSKMQRLYQANGVLSPQALDDILTLLTTDQRGIIVCGPQIDSAFPEVVAALASRLGWPILADPLSQVRCGPHNVSAVVDAYDILLRDDGFATRQQPDVIFRFGQTPTSKTLGQRLKTWTSAVHITVDESIHWRDPFHATTHAVICHPTLFCKGLTERWDSRAYDEQSASSWCLGWLDANARVRHTLQTIAAESTAITGEGQIFLELQPLLADGSWLVVGNSMPVRDLDTFWSAAETNVQIVANRGASGIDGVVSTAFGVSAGSPDNAETILVIGDVSFYHDLNGLMAWTRNRVPLCIILVHNNGGGIFSFLPQANHPETFAYFGTPHDVDFRLAVEMYGGTYEKVTDWPAFRQAVTERKRTGFTLIEVNTTSEDNVAWNREIIRQVLEAVRDRQ